MTVTAKTPEILRIDWQLGRTVDPAALARWEQSTGYRLPDDYRRFLLTFNGGVVKPWIFRHDHRDVHDAQERESLLDYLYDWTQVVEMSEIGVPRGQAALPPHHIVIGQDPGGAGVLLSLDPADHGKISYWLRVLLTWGEPPNDTIGFIADSFAGFVRSLFDDGVTKNSYWRVAAKKRPPVPLVF